MNLRGFILLSILASALMISGIILGPPLLLAREKATLTIALTGKFPPFSFYSEKGELAGFDVDVATGIAKQLDRKLILVTTEWDGIIAGLLLKKYDAIVGAMAITPERSQKVNFSRPYASSGAQLFIHRQKQGKIGNINDLRKARVGVGLGETYEQYLREKHPEIVVVTYKSMTDIFQDVLNRRLDGFVTDKLVGLYQITQGGMPFVAAGPLLYEEKLAIPVTQDNGELLKRINTALLHMENSGELTTFHDKWFASPSHQEAHAVSPMGAQVIMPKLLRGFGITLLVGLSSSVLGFIVAIPFGIVLQRNVNYLTAFLRFGNDFIRATPLLIQLFFVYFGAPQIGIVLSPLQASIITLTVNASAYMAEVIRSGLMAVDYGQNLAGIALGLTQFQVFRFIIWPQALRVALPSLMNAVVALIKDTSLIAVISVAEVVREAQSIISVTYNPIKYYFIVGLLFFMISFPLMKLSGRLEKKIKGKGFAHA